MNSINLIRGYGLLIFSHGHILSKLRVFVRFENSFLPRIWKVSNLVFMFDVFFSFMLNNMMVTGVRRSWNWQVAITICNSYRLQTINCDNYPYILQWIINSLWHRSITFVKKFLVYNMRNHSYGKSSEFQFYEIIKISVQLVGYSP